MLDNIGAQVGGVHSAYGPTTRCELKAAWRKAQPLPSLS